MVVLAPAGGNTLEVIARPGADQPESCARDDPPLQRDGDGQLGPRWAGGRPRRITIDDESLIIETAKKRPAQVGAPFGHWSLWKLRRWLGESRDRPAVIVISKEQLRQILDRHEVSFQRTKTWKEPDDPDKEAKLDRIEEVIMNFPGRTFASDEFGPLATHPVGGCCWAKVRKPQRNRANYHKTCGVRQFHACYSIGDDTMWGVVRNRKGTDNSLAAIKSCRAARPDGETIYVTLDNLSAHKAKKISRWCEKNSVELCFTPTYSSWANPIECHLGPLRDFVLNNSDHPNHRVLTCRLHAYLRWRNTHDAGPAMRERLRKERARCDPSVVGGGDRPATAAPAAAAA